MSMKIDDIMLEGYGTTGKKERPYGEKYTSGLYRLKNKVLTLSLYDKIYINFIQLLNLEEYYLEANLESLLNAIHKLEDYDDSIKKYGFSVYEKLKDSKLTFKKILRKVFIFLNTFYEIAQDYVISLAVDSLANMTTNKILSLCIQMIIPSIIIKFFTKIFKGILSYISEPSKIKYTKSILSEMNTVVYDLKRLSKDDSDGLFHIDLYRELSKNYYPHTFRIMLADINTYQVVEHDRFTYEDLKKMGVPYSESKILRKR